MSGVTERRLKVIDQLYRTTPYDIYKFIDKTTTNEWLKIALENNLFAIEKWEQCDNIDGFLAATNLIKKYGSSLADNAILKELLYQFLSFEKNEFYSIVSENIQLYIDWSATNNIISSLNEHLIIKSDKQYTGIYRVYSSLLRSVNVNEGNIKLISSVYANALILGKPFDGLEYVFDDYKLLVEAVVEKLTSNLDMLRKIDCLFKDDYRNVAISIDLSRYKYYFDEDGYLQILIDHYLFQNDYLFSDVMQWVSSFNHHSAAYMRRNCYVELLNKYLSHKINYEIVLNLINTNSVYYKKVGIHFLNVYFPIEYKLMVLKELYNYYALLNDVSISNVLSFVVDECADELDKETRDRIIDAFKILNDCDYQDHYSLIRSYNLLKEKMNINCVTIPLEYSKMMPSEGVGQIHSGIVSQVSLLDDNYIIGQFDKSIFDLNKIYLTKQSVEVDFFVEKSYRGTVKRILEISKKNQFQVSYEILSLLDSNVVTDIIEIVESKNANKIIHLLFSRMKELADNTEKKYAINLQIKLAYAIQLYMKNTSVLSDIKLDWFINQISEFVDFQEPIRLDDYTSSIGNIKFQELVNRYYNSATGYLMDQLLILANNEHENINEVYSYICHHSNSLLMIGALGVHLNLFQYHKVTLKLDDILDTDDKKEMFLCCFLSSGNINNENAKLIEQLLIEYVFEKDLKCKDQKIYENIGRFVYLVYENTNIYNELFERIFSEYGKMKDSKLSLILHDILWTCTQSNKQERQYKTVFAMYQQLLYVPNNDLLGLCFEILTKLELTQDTANLGYQLITLVKNAAVDHYMLRYFKYLNTEENVEKNWGRKVSNSIMNKAKELNSYYCYDLDRLNRYE